MYKTPQVFFNFINLQLNLSTLPKYWTFIYILCFTDDKINTDFLFHVVLYSILYPKMMGLIVYFI